MEGIRHQDPPALVYRVQVSLEGVRPDIWRLLDVRGDLSLADLHEVIQLAFGWRLGRSHVFVGSDGRRWSDGRWYGEGGAGGDERNTSLAEALTPQSGWLTYVYDPRAGWKHQVDLVTISATEAAQPPALLVLGERRGPLEDVGGPQGYAELLSDLDDSVGWRRASTLAWVNATVGPWHDSFDPHQLDRASVNRALVARFAPEAGTARGHPSLLVALAARMYPGLRREFDDYLARAELESPVTIDPHAAEAMVQPFSWLLGVLGSTEVRVSDSSRLPTSLGAERPPRGAQVFTDAGVAVADLLKSALRWQLARRHNGRLELTPIGEKLTHDPEGLWWHLARTWFPGGRATAARDASTLLLVELAVGAHVSGHDVADSVAFGLDSLGWVDPVNHASIYEELVWTLVAVDLPPLRALGLLSGGSKDRPAVTGPHARTFARAVLRGDGERDDGEPSGDNSATAGPRSVSAGRWRRRPIPR